MKVLAWHVHGSWMTSFVQGPDEYLVPVVPDRGPDGLGRARTWDWPSGVREVAPEDLAAEDLDVVVLQRPRDWELAERWTGRRPGRDVPAVYVEHDAPTGSAAASRHWLADQTAVPIVHVTHFNAAMWDNGRTPVIVVEHGIPDPGALWTGTAASVAAVVNEPVRRWRVAGTDLLAQLAESVPVEVYGMATDELRRQRPQIAAVHNLDQADLHRALAQHRVYLHPYRWTSLGLALIEAMTLGMPVLAFAGTAAPEAIPPEAGVVSADPDVLLATARSWLADPAQAAAYGAAARRHALEHFGLGRFLTDWQRALKEVTR